VREFAAKLGKPLVGITAAAERALAGAAWLGNVRELRNTIERACILAEGELVTEHEVTGCLAPLAGPAPASRATAVPPAAAGDGELLSTVERDHIVRALARTGGNKKAAARILGLSRRALYRRLERLDLGETITRRPAAGPEQPGPAPSPAAAAM
jgi:DNA-binding NtrC family response regulator